MYIWPEKWIKTVLQLFPHQENKNEELHHPGAPALKLLKY